MTRKLIAVDVDEVLFPFLTHMNDYVNGLWGTHFKIEDYKSYIFEEVWGGEKRDVDRLIDRFGKTGKYYSILPLEGAQEGIERLSRENDLIVVTNRPVKIKAETERQFEQFFPGRFKKVFCLGGDRYDSVSPIPKFQICKREGAEIIIEDGLRNALECIKVGIGAFIFDYSWNQSKTANQNGLVRIYAPHWKNLIKEYERLTK
jgi:5'(3')-deoxyribonucleotidase